MLRCKTIKTSILHVNKDGFTSPLIIATLEKRAPRPLSLRDLALLTNYPSHSTRLRHTVVTFTFDHTAVSALPLSQDFTACNMVFFASKVNVELSKRLKYAVKGFKTVSKGFSILLEKFGRGCTQQI